MRFSKRIGFAVLDLVQRIDYQIREIVDPTPLRLTHGYWYVENRILYEMVGRKEFMRRQGRITTWIIEREMKGDKYWEEGGNTGEMAEYFRQRLRTERQKESLNSDAA